MLRPDSQHKESCMGVLGKSQMPQKGRVLKPVSVNTVNIKGLAYEFTDMLPVQNFSYLLQRVKSVILKHYY